MLCHIMLRTSEDNTRTSMSRKHICQASIHVTLTLMTRKCRWHANIDDTQASMTCQRRWHARADVSSDAYAWEMNIFFFINRITSRILT